jgi:hypothetical protein
MTQNLAPNGKKSNLNAEQYALVRTPAFKKWFGDWENDPENASKVVDENGEPMVVFRGDSDSSKRGNIFKTGYNRLKYITKNRLPNDYFFYFVNNYDVAKSYAENQVEEHNNEIDYGKKGKKWNPLVVGYFLNIRKAIDITPNNPLFISYNEHKRLDEKRGDSDIYDYNYYIPYRYGSYTTYENVDLIFRDALGEYLKDKDLSEYEIERLKKHISNKYNGLEETWSYFAEFKNQDYKSTILRLMYKGMEEKNFDGLIFLELTGYEIKDDYDKIIKGEIKHDYHSWIEKQFVYAAMHSNQIKLADGSNTTFDTNNPDIRYAKGGRLRAIGNNFKKELKIKNLSNPIFKYKKYGIELDDGSITWYDGNVFTIWIYDDNKAEEKLKSGEYDYFNPPTYVGDDVGAIWDEKEYLNKFKGTKHLVGYIEGKKNTSYQNRDKILGVTIGIMTVRPDKRRLGINSLMIKYIRDKFGLKQEQIDFYLPSNEGQSFIRSKKYSHGGDINSFMNQTKDWQKLIGSKMNVFISIPNEFTNPSDEMDESSVILDLFEKIDQTLDAKKYMNTLLEMSDAHNVTIYLEPIPRYKYITDDAKKKKITKDYLIKYYEKFGFKKLENDWMVRKMEKGGRTIAQTPAPKSDRIHGSSINKVGSASTEGVSIKLSKNTLDTLQKKLKEFKKNNHNSNNITLLDLKKVYRRGSGAYSSSHRPTITGGAPNTRNAWAMARVNKFLEKAAGHKVKAAYVQDDDLIKYKEGGEIKSSLKDIIDLLQRYQFRERAVNISPKGRFLNFINSTKVNGEEVDCFIDTQEKAIVLDSQHGLKEIGYDLKFMEAYFKKNRLKQNKYEEGGSKYEDGGIFNKLGITEEQINSWKESHKVTNKQNRNDIVRDSAKLLSEGKISQDEYLKIVKENQPIKPFKVVPKIPTVLEVAGSLKKNQLETGIIGYTKFIEDGEYVASRLDIPAYENYDIWVVSVHSGDKEGLAIGYGQTAYLKDVNFKSFPKTALKIATGESAKSTIGRMFGTWVNKDPKQVRDMAIQYLNNPDWIQVGMNPFRHSWFYDKSDGMPLLTTTEVIQVGALVLAKNAIKTTPKNPIFMVDKSNPDIKFEKGGEIKITCINCGWSWDANNSYPKDMYICHKCGYDNSKNNNMQQVLAEGGHVKGDGKKTNNAKEGGFFEGRSHAEGGIKAINVDTKQPIEVEGNEVVINKRSVADNTLHDFNGKKMTNKQILSEINQAGGGVAFAHGGELESSDYMKMGGKLSNKYLHLSSDVYARGGKIDSSELNPTETHILTKLGYSTKRKCEIAGNKLNEIQNIEKKGIVYTTPAKNNKGCFEVRLTDYGLEMMHGVVLDYDVKSFAKGGTMDCGCNNAYPDGAYMKEGGISSTNIEKKYFDTIDTKYKNQFELNKAIEELIDSKSIDEFTPAERTFIGYYAGYGGLEKFGAEGKGLLYEYFTPPEISKKMWGLAYKHGFKGGKILEPSCGIGEFIKYAPEQEMVTGYEINETSAKICKVLYPKANIQSKYFETIFIKNADSVKNKLQGIEKYSLVIGNPPYGKMRSKYSGLGEKTYTKANNYIDYFIFRGLDLLEKDGLLIYIIGTEVAIGGTPFLQQPMNPVKMMIAEKADLIDAYRLPNGLFETTDVVTDIIVLKKK